MNRDYDSPNRYPLRGTYANQFAHPGNSPNHSPGTRTSGSPQTSNNPHQFPPSQLNMQQRLPPRMSPPPFSSPLSYPFTHTPPPPFSPTPPPSNSQQHHIYQLQQQQHQYLQQLIVRQQQQLPLNNEEHMILNQYYTLIGAPINNLSQNAQQWQQASAPSVQSFQHSFPGQPPLPPPMPPPPQQPQQPPPPDTSEPPPFEQPSSYLHNQQSTNDRAKSNPWSSNNQHGEQHQQQQQQQQPEGQRGRRRNRNRNKNGNPKQQQRNNQINWSGDSSSQQSEVSTMSGPTGASDNSNNWSMIESSKKNRENTAGASDVDEEDTDVNIPQTKVNKRSKRKSMSTQNTSKEFNAEYATKALELEHGMGNQRLPTLILKFPDPELSKDIIKGYSPLIESVHFQQPSTPRYCFVNLKMDSDVDKVKEELSQIDFGTGKIRAEVKNASSAHHEQDSIEDIDPYTIYVGNLPTNVCVQRVKGFFPNAARIDIGYAQRMKYTRYAFIRFATVEESFAGYHLAIQLDLGSRSLVVRFRRTRGNIGLNTNDPDGKKQSRRKRKEMLDAEAIASEGIVADMNTTECDINGARQPGMHCSDDSNDSNDSIDDIADDVSLNIVNIKPTPSVVLPLQIKEEPGLAGLNDNTQRAGQQSKIQCDEDSNDSTDAIVDDISLNIVNLKKTPAVVLPVQIKVEPGCEPDATQKQKRKRTECSDAQKSISEYSHDSEDSNDGIEDLSLHIVNITKTPAVVLPIKIKKEPTNIGDTGNDHVGEKQPKRRRTETQGEDSFSPSGIASNGGSAVHRSQTDCSDDSDDSIDDIEDDISLNIVNINPVPVIVLPLQVKQEDQANNLVCSAEIPSTSLAADGSESIPLPVTPTEIKKEYDEDDEADNTVPPELPHWEQNLIDCNDIKREIEDNPELKAAQSESSSTIPADPPTDGMPDVVSNSEQEVNRNVANIVPTVVQRTPDRVLEILYDTLNPGASP